jgi:hypothetical protein
LAVDSLSRKIFFVDNSQKKIGVINMDGKNKSFIMNANTREGLVSGPMALALDHENR